MRDSISVILKNGTSSPIYLQRTRGESWQGFAPMTIAPRATLEVAQLLHAKSGTWNWGWIDVGLTEAGRPPFQLFVQVYGSTLQDWCIQWFDYGNDTSGKTIYKTKAHPPVDDSVTLELGFEFDPWVTRLAGLKPDHLLSDLTIPGTHDSGTSSLGGSSRTQDRTIPTQLIMGVRHFDIRIKNVTGDDDPFITHGSDVSPVLRLSTVANYFFEFLAEEWGTNSSQETIVVQVKVDDGPKNGVHRKVLKQFKVEKDDPHPIAWTYPFMAPPPDSSKDFGLVPTLADLGGRIVLVRRYSDVGGDESDPTDCTSSRMFVSGADFNAWSKNKTKKWVDAFDDYDPFKWPNHQDNFGHFGSWIDYRNRNGLSWIIQDDYMDAPAVKFAIVELYLEAAANTFPHAWFLNFANCVPPIVANQTNAAILEYFTRPGERRTRFGTLLMDFVEAELVEPVYQANWNDQ